MPRSWAGPLKPVEDQISVPETDGPRGGDDAVHIALVGATGPDPTGDTLLREGRVDAPVVDHELPLDPKTDGAAAGMYGDTLELETKPLPAVDPLPCVDAGPNPSTVEAISIGSKFEKALAEAASSAERMCACPKRGLLLENTGDLELPIACAACGIKGDCLAKVVPPAVLVGYKMGLDAETVGTAPKSLPSVELNTLLEIGAAMLGGTELRPVVAG